MAAVRAMVTAVAMAAAVAMATATAMAALRAITMVNAVVAAVTTTAAMTAEARMTAACLSILPLLQINTMKYQILSQSHPCLVMMHFLGELTCDSICKGFLSSELILSFC